VLSKHQPQIVEAASVEAGSYGRESRPLAGPDGAGREQEREVRLARFRSKRLLKEKEQPQQPQTILHHSQFGDEV
jgi:hypothetical protein